MSLLAMGRLALIRKAWDLDFFFFLIHEQEGPKSKHKNHLLIYTSEQTEGHMQHFEEFCA